MSALFEYTDVDGDVVYLSRLSRLSDPGEDRLVAIVIEQRSQTAVSHLSRHAAIRLRDALTAALGDEKDKPAKAVGAMIDSSAIIAQSWTIGSATIAPSPERLIFGIPEASVQALVVAAVKAGAVSLERSAS